MSPVKKALSFLLSEKKKASSTFPKTKKKRRKRKKKDNAYSFSRGHASYHPHEKIITIPLNEKERKAAAPSHGWRRKLLFRLGGKHSIF